MSLELVIVLASSAVIAAIVYFVLRRAQKRRWRRSNRIDEGIDELWDWINRR